MKRSVISFLLLSVLTLFTGCSQQDALEEIIPQYFVEELHVWDFTVQDGVNKMLEELDVDPTEGTVKKVMDLLKRTMSRKIRAVSLTYNTVDPFGNPVVATGAFFYPLDMKVKGIVEMPPIAHLDRNASAAIYVGRHRFYEECFSSLLGYITINPDLIGVLTTQEYNRPFLHMENTGIVAYHMHKAVEEYLLLTENYKLGKHSTIMGYSLGGSSAVSMAKYYSDNKTGIIVDEVLTGGGVYDAITAFKSYARTEKSDYLAIPCVILAMNSYYNLNLDFSKIFANGMENPVNSPDPAEGGDGYAYWFDNTHGSGSIYNRWGSNLRNYMHEDFFNEELTGEFAKLKECLEANSVVYHWNPGPFTEIRLTHSGEDNLIPVECSDLMYEVYRKNGAAITYVRTTGDHYQAGAEYFVTSLLYLLAK